MRTLLLLLSLIMLLAFESEAKTTIITYHPGTESFQTIPVENIEVCNILGELFLEEYPDADWVCLDE